MSAITLRPLADDDGPAYAALMRASPDTGAVRFSQEYVHDPIAVIRALRPDTLGVVAENAARELVAAALVSFGVCAIEGAVRPYALLNTLAVRPDYRRRGIAAKLTRWRLERAEHHVGADGVVLATIQAGNAGSFANARKWATQIFGRIATVAHPMRMRPPRASHYDVREPREDEWERVAAAVARFEGRANLHVPETAESLRTWAGAAPFGNRFRYHLVAVDETGEPVAGIAVVVQATLSRLHVEHVPPAIRLANVAVRVIPRDRLMRQIAVQRVWFAPRAENAASAVWEHARWAYRDSANTMLTWFDAAGPVAGALPVRWAPKTTGVLAVRSPVRLDESRPLVPLV